MGFHRNLETNDRNVKVHVTWSVNDNNKPIVLHAYAITANGVRIDGSKIKKITARSVNELESKIIQLKARVMQELAQRTGPAVVKRKREKTVAESVLTKALDYIEEHELVVSDSWGERYQRSNMIYFRNNILGFLSERLDDWQEEDLTELQQRIVGSILKKKRSAGHTDTAAKSADKYLATADAIYQCMQSIDQTLPPLSLHPKGMGHHIQKEWPKWIPPKVRHQLAVKIAQLVEVDPRMAVGAVMMYDAGLRPAEAAAVLPEQVIHRPTVTYVAVYYQVVDGKRIPYLKTDNAYRLAPLTEWGKTLITKAFEKIQLDPSEADKPLCDSDKLSKWLKKTLFDEGFSGELIKGYIVRRDWASRAHAICGLTTEEIDYLMGHDRKLPKRRSQEFRTEEGMAKISMMLERYVTDPDISKHPACRPYQVTHGTDLEIIPYESIRLVNAADVPLRIDLDVMAVASSEPLMIVAPMGSRESYTKRMRSTRGCIADTRIIGQQNFEIKEDGRIGEQESEETC